MVTPNTALIPNITVRHYTPLPLKILESIQLQKLDPTTRRKFEFIIAMLSPNVAGEVKVALFVTGIPEPTAYYWKKHDENFRIAWEDAKHAGDIAIKSEAFTSFRNNVRKGKESTVNRVVERMRPDLIGGPPQDAGNVTNVQINNYYDYTPEERGSYIEKSRRALEIVYGPKNAVDIEATTV